MEESKDTVMEKRIEHDKIAMENISQTLGLDKCEVNAVVRIGKPCEKPRPMKVVLEERHQREELLRASKNLGTTKWGHCYIKPDLTPMEKKSNELSGRNCRKEQTKERKIS